MSMLNLFRHNALGFQRRDHVRKLSRHRRTALRKQVGKAAVVPQGSFLPAREPLKNRIPDPRIAQITQDGSRVVQLVAAGHE